jgi:hypothetical protein
MPVRRAEPQAGEINFAADQALPLLRLFYGKQPLDEAQRAGVRLTGDAALARRFVSVFSLPPKVG